MKTKVIAIDFSSDSSIYDKVKREIEGLEVGVLGKQYYFSLKNFHSLKNIFRDLYCIGNYEVGSCNLIYCKIVEKLSLLVQVSVENTIYLISCINIFINK